MVGLAPIFFKKMLLYIYILSLAILFYKIIFLPLNNIIDSFKSIVIAINFSSIILQTVKVINFYWFTFGSTTYIIFLLTNNHSSHQQSVKQFVTLAFSSF